MRRSLIIALVIALFAATLVPMFVVHCASPSESQCGSNASALALYVQSQLAGPQQLMPRLVWRVFLLAFLASYALINLFARLRHRAIDA